MKFRASYYRFIKRTYCEIKPASFTEATTTVMYRLPLASTALLLGTLLAALGLTGPANAQDGPVHGTVQSASGQTVTIELDSGYRVEAGT